MKQMMIMMMMRRMMMMVMMVVMMRLMIGTIIINTVTNIINTPSHHCQCMYKTSYLASSKNNRRQQPQHQDYPKTWVA